MAELEVTEEVFEVLAMRAKKRGLSLKDYVSHLSRLPVE